MDEAKLDALDGRIDEIEAMSPEAQEAQKKAAQAVDQADEQAREWGAIAYMIGGALSILAPELKAVYTEAACMKWGEAVVPVSQKYGWDGPAGVPEIGLFIASAGLAVPSYMVIRAKLAQIKAAKEAADQARTVDNQADGGIS